MQTTTDLEAMRELLESMQGQIASLVSQNDALAKQVFDLSEDLRAQAAESDKVIASLKAELAVLALPQNQPNAPLYPAGGAPGSRPGALPHFGRPRYLGPPPRARSTAG